MVSRQGGPLISGATITIYTAAKTTVAMEASEGFCLSNQKTPKKCLPWARDELMLTLTTELQTLVTLWKHSSM